MPTGHTVVAFDTEMKALHHCVVRMGHLAADQLERALQVVAAPDEKAAAEIVSADAEIDRLEQEVEAKALRLLALRQPMARDLREVITALKVSHNLERVGDFGSNIAKRSVALSQFPADLGPAKSLVRMGKLAAKMIRDVMESYEEQNHDKAIAVRDADAEVDAVYTSVFRELLTYMMETPRQITPSTHLLFAAKNIERIGDHATNIAESVCFLVRGRLPDEERAKGDESSFAVVPPRSEQGR